MVFPPAPRIIVARTRSEDKICRADSAGRQECSFLKKRPKKLLLSGHGLPASGPWPESKSLLLLFFRKEGLRKNVPDDVDLRKPPSSFRCQPKEAGLNKETDDACHGVRESH
jgi:hypothetical protein